VTQVAIPKPGQEYQLMMVDASSYVASGSLRDFVRSASAEPKLGHSEDASLIEAARSGDALAADRLIRAHLREVVDAATQHRGNGIPMPELIRRGIDGLVAAIDDFDPRAETSFRDFALRRIRAEIRRVALQG
jgi:RNA polymerase primary sigma factor